MGRRTRKIIISSALLAIMSIGTLLLALYGYETYVSYQNPNSYVPVDTYYEPFGSMSSIPSEMGMTPLANYTLVFILDGLRADTFFST